jgi:hypothetical protein
MSLQEVTVKKKIIIIHLPLKKRKRGDSRWARWLKPIILATWEMEIKRIRV